MFFAKSALIFVFVQTLGGVVTGQVPDWFSQIQQDFSNSTFPLRRCLKRDNVAPRNGSMCGPKSKTCFFGDQVCGAEALGQVFPYPTKSCVCNGTSRNNLGTWICQLEACPPGYIPPTDAPVAVPPTDAPVDIPPTDAPVAVPPTDAPAAVPPTDAPVDIPPTDAPVAVPPTDAPANIPPTDAPIAVPPTDAPVAVPPTDAPVAAPPTDAPVIIPPSDAPVDFPPTDAPVAVPEPCKDVAVTDQPWVDSDGDSCLAYGASSTYCGLYGGDTVYVNFGLIANQACCLCDGGVVDPKTLVCSDITVPLDLPAPWTDSVGDTCSWYAGSPQARCVNFANERHSDTMVKTLNLTVGEACCACADIVPPTNPTCTDLAGWTLFPNNTGTCSEMTRADCQANPEAFGFTVEEACCKCGARTTNPNAPTSFNPPTAPFSAGGCTPSSTTFDMCVKLSPNIAAGDAAEISAARQRWNSIIVQDSPDFQYNSTVFRSAGFQSFPEDHPESAVDLPAFYESVCGFNPEFPQLEFTDDIDICIGQRPLPANVLAQRGLLHGDNFVRFGVLTINADEIRGLRTNGTLENIFLHELGHMLGIGLLRNLDIPVDRNCTYIGSNANRVYQEISGCSTTETVPMEEPIAIPLTIFGVEQSPILICSDNLLEECFLDEVMTTAVGDATKTPISTVTVGLLEDIGYTVDYSQADPYTKADMNASCVCDDPPLARTLRKRNPSSKQRRRQLRDDEGRATVHEYAKEELKRINKMAKSYMVNSQDENGEGAATVGITGLTILFMEDGEIFTEHVMNGEDDSMAARFKKKEGEEGVDPAVEDDEE